MKKHKVIRKPDFGFTLIEVMVALTIFAVFAAAMLLAGQSAMSTLSDMRMKQIAMWVAENQLIELRQTTRLSNLPPVGRSKNTVEMAGQNWIVQTDIMETDNEFMYRAEVAVAKSTRNNLNKDAIEHPVVNLVGFLGKH